ncbi:hypothetical protein K1719_031017 [Acacia pycnantha]|nr:hypothetical protein K1719_031017 [Acacia pycnantha]
MVNIGREGESSLCLINELVSSEADMEKEQGNCVVLEDAQGNQELVESFEKDLKDGDSLGDVKSMEEHQDQTNDKDFVMVNQIEKAKENSFPLPSHLVYHRNQISYRNKLMEKDEEVFSQELEDQIKEWLCEENEISPPLSEEQEKLLESLPKLSMPDERLKALCQPWKDALILTLLGKSTSLAMMKDRVTWLLRSKRFDLIDLPNNYFVFRTKNSDLRLRLLFDGLWLIRERVVGDGDKEYVNLEKGENSMLVIGLSCTKSATKRETKEKGKILKEKEGKINNILVGNPLILGQPIPSQLSVPKTSNHKVNVPNLRPNGLSSMINKKKAARAHKVIIGSINPIELSKTNDMKE